ncbi:MAG: hypothetical protein B6A08_20175 [Sorangiineae bacterium NIC37A_2]|jgi:hypothetical protein|nr:MAG: hypothetical protein B6A08_20175 [Sorangiineae bacterium NIC37A_2]
MSAAWQLTIGQKPDAQRVGLQSLPAANDNTIEMIAIACEKSHLGIFVFAHKALPACEAANDGLRL